jgi:hypothetical protein
MPSSEKPDNQRAESESRMSETSSNRRRFLAQILTLGATAVFAPKALAEYDPYRDRLRPVLKAQFQNKDAAAAGEDAPPEALTEEAKILMNKSMEVFWRTYLHCNFWHNLTTNAPDVQKILEIAMAKENRDKLWYKGDADGVITIHGVITVQDKPQPIKIEISYGKVTEVNGIKINHESLIKYDEDWSACNRRIERISPKISLMNQLAGTPEASSIPPITDVEWQFYYQYSFEWPHRFYRLLELKGDLTPEESALKDKLKSLLENHPQNEDDFKQSIQGMSGMGQISPSMPISSPSVQASVTTSAQLANEAGRQTLGPKSPQLIVWRRKKMEIAGPTSGKLVMQATPEDMVELVLFSDKSRRAFAGMSRDGFVMVWKNGKWTRSDDSEMPFANMSAQKTDPA